MDKTSYDFLDVLRGTIEDKVATLDQTIYCKIVGINEDYTLDVTVVPDEITRIKSVVNASRYEFNVGDYGILYKIGNNLANAFIIAKLGPSYEDNQPLSKQVVGGGKAGQIYYNTADKGYRYHNGTAWVSITAEAVKSIIAGNGLTSSGTDTVTISLGTPSASGSGSNTYGSNNVTTNSHTHQINLPDATTSAKGVIELATDAEAEAGTDTTHAINAKQLAAAKQSAIDSAKVTIQTSNGITGGSSTASNSYTLSGVNASTTTKGVVQLATQAEVNTGTDTSKVVTPSTLGKGKASGVASLDANGKIVLSQIPDAVYGNVLYGGNFVYSTESQSQAVYPSSSLKARLGITSSIIDLSENATGSQGGSIPTYGYEELEGVYFICQIQGTGVTSFAFAGEEFEIGDWVISTGEGWQKVDNTDAVKSVNGQIGVVNITKVDSATNADTATNAINAKYADEAQAVSNQFSFGAFPINTSTDNTFDGSAATALRFASPLQVTKSGNTTTVSLPSVIQKFTTTITGDGTTTDFTVQHGLGADVMVQVYLTGSTIGRRTGNELVFVDTYVEDANTHQIHLVFATAPPTSQTFKVVVIG